MNTSERYYQRVIGSIGIAMLVFFGLLTAFGETYALVTTLIEQMSLPRVGIVVLSQLYYGAGYMLSFMLPVIFLRVALKARKCNVAPMLLTPRLSPYLPLIICAGIAVTFSFAIINSYLLELFDPFGFASGSTVSDLSGMAPYEIVLNLIVICVVPGFCEEFLFRGAILTNCLPFGRTTALIVSSLLFAVMHQNFAQLLYTFCAGLVLGLVYEKTGSIWNCTILHICNNFISVLQETVLAKLGYTTQGMLVITLIEAVVFLAGSVSAAILIAKFFSGKGERTEGDFGVNAPMSDAYALVPIVPKRARLLFLTPTMVVFFVLCFSMMILRVVMAVMI